MDGLCPISEHLMERHILPPNTNKHTDTNTKTKQWDIPFAIPFLSLMKKHLYSYFFSHLKKVRFVRLMNCLSTVFHWTTTNHCSLKYQCTEAVGGSQYRWKWKKNVALETHLLKWKCYRVTAQERNGSPGSAQSYQKSDFLPKLLKDIDGHIKYITRILLLVIFRMALKGSELHSPQFKVFVTQSYCNIHYKIYHYRNTIYQSQISASISLGFHFLVL